MTEAPRPDTSMLQVVAAMLASSLVGVPLFVAVDVRMVLYAINPRGLEGTGYELEIVFAFAATFAGALVATVIVLRRLRTRAGDRAVLRIPFMVLFAQILIGVAVVTALIFTPDLDSAFL